MAFAEAVWITCCDRLLMPMEIAFARHHEPTVSLCRVAPLPLDYWMTCRDMVEARSRFYNKDRFYNSKGDKLRRDTSFQEWTLDAEVWLLQLKHLMSPETTIYVRGPSQYSFFKHVCGYPNVKRIKLSVDRPVVEPFHTHYRSKLLMYPCPGIEVATVWNYKEMVTVVPESD